MRVFCFYIMLLLLGCSGCKEGALSPKEELPPATQEGLNTFGCLVNGEVWVPKPSINPAIHKLSYEYLKKEEYFQISATRFFNNNGIGVRQLITITINEGMTTTGNYILDSPDKRKAKYVDLESGCRHLTDMTQTGTLEITKLDTVNHIIAGTFEFTVWTEGCDTIRVTDGRFDIKYQQ